MTNKIALVTGAGSGIGRAASLVLQEAGYSVVLAGRRAAQLEETVARANPKGGRMLPVPTDVSRPEAVRALFDTARETFGRLHRVAAAFIGKQIPDLPAAGDGEQAQFSVANLGG